MVKLKSSTAMSKFCCITDLICCMINEVEKLMKGSVQDQNFFIFHDALVLMTEKETINWMRKNGYLHICLLPLNGLQDGVPYSCRPVGNIPELVPLYNSLNCGILHSLLIHSVLNRYILYGEET